MESEKRAIFHQRFSFICWACCGISLSVPMMWVCVCLINLILWCKNVMTSKIDLLLKRTLYMLIDTLLISCWVDKHLKMGQWWVRKISKIWYYSKLPLLEPQKFLKFYTFSLLQSQNNLLLFFPFLGTKEFHMFLEQFMKT